VRIVYLSLLALLAACDTGEQARSSVAGGDVGRGKLLLAQYQCGSCHRIPDVAAARGEVGPALDSFGRRSYIAGQIPNRPDALARWIVDPASLKPGTAMPAMGVSAADARDMAAYLYALP
jgi:cytochrome c